MSFVKMVVQTSFHFELPSTLQSYVRFKAVAARTEFMLQFCNGIETSFCKFKDDSKLKILAKLWNLVKI